MWYNFSYCFDILLVLSFFVFPHSKYNYKIYKYVRINLCHFHEFTPDDAHGEGTMG